MLNGKFKCKFNEVIYRNNFVLSECVIEFRYCNIFATRLLNVWYRTKHWHVYIPSLYFPIDSPTHFACTFLLYLYAPCTPPSLSTHWLGLLLQYHHWPTFPSSSFTSLLRSFLACKVFSFAGCSHLHNTQTWWRTRTCNASELGLDGESAEHIPIQVGVEFNQFRFRCQKSFKSCAGLYNIHTHTFWQLFTKQLDKQSTFWGIYMYLVRAELQPVGTYITTSTTTKGKSICQY